MTETTEPRAVVTWEGPGEPIVLTVYGPDGEEVAVPLLPKRVSTTPPFVDAMTTPNHIKIESPGGRRHPRVCDVMEHILPE